MLTSCLPTLLLTALASAVLSQSTLPSSCSSPIAGVKTVMTIVLENEDAASVLQDSYLGNSLKSRGYYLNNYRAVSHPSQPNYIAMVAGDTFGVSNDNNVDLSQTSIADLLENKKLTWKAYNENYTGACNTASSLAGGIYARKHNPLISFTSISQNPTRCANIVPSSQLDTDVQNNALPNYAFYTPNQSNDGHDTSIAYASNWLKGFLEPKLSDPRYANTLFFIVFDESSYSSSTNQVYAFLVGAGVTKVGQVDNSIYTHYSWLATVENLFKLGNLGRNDGSASVIPFSDSTVTCTVTAVVTAVTTTAVTISACATNSV